MLEQRYRQYYQQILVEPVVKVVGNVSPTLVTVLSGIIGVLVVPVLYFHHQWLAVAILALSGYLDTLDGSLARINNTATELGGVLDIVMDRIVESAAVFALFLFNPLWGIACFLMLFSNLICITSFLVVGIYVEQNSKKGFFYHSGLIERAEAFIFYALMMLLPAYFYWFAYSYIALVLLSAVLHLRFFNTWQKAN